MPARKPRYIIRFPTGSDRSSWFRGGLVLKAHRLLYLSTLGLRVIKKKKDQVYFGFEVWGLGDRAIPIALGLVFRFQGLWSGSSMV